MKNISVRTAWLLGKQDRFEGQRIPFVGILYKKLRVSRISRIKAKEYYLYLWNHEANPPTLQTHSVVRVGPRTTLQIV